jgi:hypothetical protein
LIEPTALGVGKKEMHKGFYWENCGEVATWNIECNGAAA